MTDPYRDYALIRTLLDEFVPGACAKEGYEALDRLQAK